MCLNMAGSADTGLEKIQKEVLELYKFRDTFFDSHKIEEASQKNELVKERLQTVLQQLNTLQDTQIGQGAEFHLLYGKSLNVSADFDQNAFDSLSKAVKLDPKLHEAWVQLGECYWKKGDVSGAHNCFIGALNHNKDKVALRNLSIVLRQLGKTNEEKKSFIQESVDKAKEAVSLDIKDGTSWFILGNAYLAQFFSSKQDPKVLQQCSVAYSNAEKDSISKNQPDLPYNKATLQRYREEYENALNGFSLATALDPTWQEAKEKEQQLLKYLKNTVELIQTKGKIKGKKLQSMRDSIKETDLGPYAGGEFTSKGKTVKLKNLGLQELQPGTNKETVTIGRVVGSVMNEESVPFTFGLLDKEGTCVSVTVYNIAPGYGFKIGDSIGIPEPWVDDINVKYKEHEFQFRNIRVENPLVCVVNGRKQGKDVLAPCTLATSVMSQ